MSLDKIPLKSGLIVFLSETAIQCVLCSDPKTRHLCPTWLDIDMLESLHTMLSSLHITDLVSREKCGTISAILTLLSN